MTIFRDVQVQGGEEIDPVDITNISRYIRAQIFESLACLARIDQWKIVSTIHTCFAMGDGGAIEIGGLGLAVSHKAGVIFQQKTGSVDGTETTFLPYYNGGGELNFTLATADPSNDRIDLVCVLIDCVDDVSSPRDFEDATSGAKSSISALPTRKTRNQVQVVTGTPSGSPAVPATPSGYVPISAIRVRAGVTNLAASDAWDLRVPLPIRIVDVPGSALAVSDLDIAGGGGGHWTRGPVLGLLTDLASDGAGARVAMSMAPCSGGARVIGVGIVALNASGAGVKLQRQSLVGALAVDLLDLSASLGADFSGRNYAEASLMSGIPYWGNGKSAGLTNDLLGGEDAKTKLQLSYTSNATHICVVAAMRWIIAGY